MNWLRFVDLGGKMGLITAMSLQVSVSYYKPCADKRGVLSTSSTASLWHLQSSCKWPYLRIELPAKLLDYFLRSNKSNINQSASKLLEPPENGDLTEEKMVERLTMVWRSRSVDKMSKGFQDLRVHQIRIFCINNTDVHKQALTIWTRLLQKIELSAKLLHYFS